MTNKPPPPKTDPPRAWKRTVSGDLPAARPPRLPPLQRNEIQGLDVSELESQTVFDQLFGPAPAPKR